MTEQAAGPHRPGLGSPQRIEFLTDGVFAIVMTLLVIEIEKPQGPADDLLHQLGEVVPTLLTYALTFLTLGALWFGNRTQGENTRRADHPLVWLTLLMLGFVALVPFSASLLYDFPTSRTAVVLFGAHLTVIYTVHGCLWLYLSLHPGLLREGVSDDYRRRSRLPAFAPAIGYAVATGLGAAVPLVGLIGYLLVPLPLIGGLFYRGLGRLHDRSTAP